MSEEKNNVQKLMNAVATELRFMSSDFSEAKRVASLYRHNVDRQPGENPELFGRILQKLPEELRGSSYAEQAAYTALTLAAFTGNNNWSAGGVADAISRIARNESVINRFRTAETAKDIDELRYRLRRVLKTIASNGEVVNYSVLAAELFKWQFSKASQIRRWERKLIK